MLGPLEVLGLLEVLNLLEVLGLLEVLDLLWVLCQIEVLDLLVAAVCSSFGLLPAHRRLDLKLSLYLFLGLLFCVCPEIAHRRKAGEGSLTSPFG